MSKCRDCGEPIQFLDGDKRPYDLTPRVHYANKIHIEAVRKSGAKRAKKAAPTAKSGSHAPPAPDQPGFKDALEALTGKPLGLKVTEARDMLKDIPEAAPADMVLAALQRMGE